MARAGTLTGLATESRPLLRYFCKIQHAAPKTMSLDYFCSTFHIFKKKDSVDLDQKTDFWSKFRKFLHFFPENDPAGHFFAANPLLLLVLPKKSCLLTRQVEPLPQLIDQDSRTPALIALHIPFCPRTNHCEILPDIFSVPTLVRSATFMEIISLATICEQTTCIWPMVFFSVFRKLATPTPPVAP